jgi:hypothetical protein
MARYNAEELYIIPDGSIRFKPQVNEEVFKVWIEGKVNLDGIDMRLYGGVVDFDATSDDDLFKRGLSVSGYNADKSHIYFEIKSKQNFAWYDKKRLNWNQMIRRAIWNVIQNEGGMDAFRRKMVGVYMAEFVEDMDELQKFIEQTRTDLFMAIESQTERQLLLVASNYYERVDPEPEDEDD